MKIGIKKLLEFDKDGTGRVKLILVVFDNSIIHIIDIVSMKQIYERKPSTETTEVVDVQIGKIDDNKKRLIIVERNTRGYDLIEYNQVMNINSE
jgi:hypothetical protein